MKSLVANVFGRYIKTFFPLKPVLISLIPTYYSGTCASGLMSISKTVYMSKDMPRASELLHDTQDNTNYPFMTMAMTMTMTMNICYWHVIHIRKIQQTIYTSIRPCCYHLAHNSLESHMANGTGSRGLCAPIYIIQGNFRIVLGKWRNAIKKNRKQQCSLYSFYIQYSLLTNSEVYYSWLIITKHFHFGSAISAKWGKTKHNGTS